MSFAVRLNASIEAGVKRDVLDTEVSVNLTNAHLEPQLEEARWPCFYAVRGERQSGYEEIVNTC